MTLAINIRHLPTSEDFFLAPLGFSDSRFSLRNHFPTPDVFPTHGPEQAERPPGQRRGGVWKFPKARAAGRRLHVGAGTQASGVQAVLFR
jgi:hypothetical protein